jgi:hypothetical protein
MLKELKIPRGPSERFFLTILHNLHFLCRHLHISISSLAFPKPHPDYAEIEILVVLNRSSGYSPIITALMANGYTVRLTQQFDPQLHGSAQVIITIPEKGFPLDIMLFEDDDQQKQRGRVLKLFLLNAMPEKRFLSSFSETDIIFFDKHRLNLRVLLHAIDSYIQRVVVPRREGIVALDERLKR